MILSIIFNNQIFNNLTLSWCDGNISNMKKLFTIGLFFVFACFMTVVPAHAYIDRDTAVIRIMNKAAGKVQTVTLPVGQNAQYEKLNMIVRSCKQTDPFDAEDFFMFIEINKSDAGQIFSGWMSANEPGDNPLQNADYDLWLVRCE